MSANPAFNPDLGQHFINNPKILGIMASPVNRNDSVIEIGSGLGSLTTLLAKKAKKVIAIEIDKKFEPALKKLQKEYKNIEVIIGNALDQNFSKGTFIISNLPYNITEPFLNKLASYKNLKARIMVGQKFATHALISDPADLNFTELSFLCNSFFNVSEIAKVPKDLFNPKPKTDSVILDLIPKRGNSIAQNLFLSQTKGSKLKNFLMNGFILLNKKITKNEARKSVQNLNLTPEVLEKSFAQLNNEEVRLLATKLQAINF